MLPGPPAENLRNQLPSSIPPSNTSFGIIPPPPLNQQPEPPAQMFRALSIEDVRASDRRELASRYPDPPVHQNSNERPPNTQTTPSTRPSTKPPGSSRLQTDVTSETTAAESPSPPCTNNPSAREPLSPGFQAISPSTRPRGSSRLITYLDLPHSPSPQTEAPQQPTAPSPATPAQANPFVPPSTAFQRGTIPRSPTITPLHVHSGSRGSQSNASATRQLEHSNRDTAAPLDPFISSSARTTRPYIPPHMRSQHTTMTRTITPSTTPQFSPPLTSEFTVLHQAPRSTTAQSRSPPPCRTAQEGNRNRLNQSRQRSIISHNTAQGSNNRFRPLF
ncbi:hypothetical protein QBC43DRAFT_290021 [Cladorrhinum sp. PSN259]|nr:hypothetical protein QBC43DRAFT_290021 [Cladorrhinum sp. PSN259]